MLESPSFSEGESHLPGTTPLAPCGRGVYQTSHFISPGFAFFLLLPHMCPPQVHGAHKPIIKATLWALIFTCHLLLFAFIFFCFMGVGSRESIHPSGQSLQAWNREVVGTVGISESPEVCGGAGDRRDPGASEGPSQGPRSWCAATRGASSPPCRHPAAGCLPSLGQFPSAHGGGQGRAATPAP